MTQKSIRFLSEFAVAEFFLRKKVAHISTAAQRKEDGMAKKIFWLERTTTEGPIKARIEAHRPYDGSLDMDDYPYIPLSTVKAAARKLGL